MPRDMPAFVAALLLGVIVAGCSGTSANSSSSSSPSASPTAAAAAPAPPDTTARSLWTYLQNAGYSGWPLWPGKGELYPGTRPHGALLTTHLNPAAYDAVTNGSTAMPDGAVIVKENYEADTTLASITVMYKSAGYDPAHHDWFWMKRLPDDSVVVAGRGATCIDCHGRHASNDFIQTSVLGGS